MDEIYQFVTSGQALIFFSVLLTFLTVFGIIYPLMKRKEAKERYKSIVTEQRRQLFDKAREDDKKTIDDQPTLSARDTFATLFKLEKLSGAKQARLLLVQAGYRNPKALLYYLVSRMVLPTLFMLLTLFFITQIQKPLSEAVKLLAILGSALFGFYLPSILVKNTALKRQEEIQITFPDALDMMLICVQGGIGIESAINRIAERIVEYSPILAEELGILSAELAMLNDRKSAYRGFADRVGSSAARTFVNAMIQAEQYGSSVSNAMRVISEELREMRMSLAEEKAASLPPKLTVPMILFFLPCLFVVILGPAGIQASQTF